jgi:methylated-DNA-[protein]-cysteine S-methyltransferase
MHYVYNFWQSPIGNLFLLANQSHFLALNFVQKSENPEINSYLNKFQPQFAKNDVIILAIAELEQYFCGKLKNFSLPVQPLGTAFQIRTWLVLQKIPYGEVISYQEEALRMKKPKAARAVGQANGKNPIPIIIPCHRVVAKNMKLGGYSCGLDIKSKLLQLEGVKGIEWV